jgi:DNA mismatch repair protein MutL
MVIQKLPQDVIKLIAAGEVINSITSVVRELVENSLDANANRIVISVWGETWQIQVADNGKGMSEKDLELCVQPHTTSKIQCREDLYNITSLGFRGEALHSISQLADLRISSRTRDDLGWEFVYQQGEVIKKNTIAMATGTIIIVNDLFGNIPLRRQGNPPFKQQIKQIQILIGELALCHPQVTWQLFVNDNSSLKISATQTAQYILPQLLKQAKLSDLQFEKLAFSDPPQPPLLREEFQPPQPPLLSEEFQPPQPPLLSGDTGGDPLQSGEFQPFQPPLLRVDSPAFSTPLTKGGGGGCSLELVLGLPDRLSRNRADWVKIGVNDRVVKIPELESIILASLSRTLPKDRFPVVFLHLRISPQEIDWNRHPAKAEVYLNNLPFWQEKVKEIIFSALKITPAQLPTNFENKRVENLLHVAESKGVYHLDNQPKNIQDEAIGLINLQAKTQIRNTYIVAEHSEGLWLIEQHIAHERVLYEQLQDTWKIVEIETPIILSRLTDKQVENLDNLGLEIDEFGEDFWAVRTIPQILLNRDDCVDTLLELSRGGDLDSAQVALACRTAIRNGTKLTLNQMQTLIDSWKITRNPHTCPHGRPIYLALDESSLYRFFRRHWVLGKSHGI